MVELEPPELRPGTQCMQTAPKRANRSVIFLSGNTEGGTGKAVIKKMPKSKKYKRPRKKVEKKKRKLLRKTIHAIR